MPELPEVETIARTLRPHLEGQSIASARLLWQRTLHSPSPEEFLDQICNQRIEQVTRRAKYIWMKLAAGAHLFVHLRMSGDLNIFSPPHTAAPHDRLLLHLQNGGTLAFNDTRKFGRVWLTNHPQDVIGALGPEPFDERFTPESLHQALNAHNRQLKPLLLDQSFLAGLGNIYTDESLHRAKLHPLLPSNGVSAEQAKVLWQAIRETLKIGIENNGASIDWVYRGGNFQNLFRVYQRTDEPCPECGTPIRKITVGQRGTHFCPACQKV
jgi:formamidopyrimidine-DNA glycosylase